MLKNVMMVVLTLAKVEGFSSKFVSLYIDPEFEIRFRFFFFLRGPWQHTFKLRICSIMSLNRKALQIIPHPENPFNFYPDSTEF